MISLDCECGRAFTAPDSRAGFVVRCPGCGLKSPAPTAARDVPAISRDDLRAIGAAWRRTPAGDGEGAIVTLLLLPFRAARAAFKLTILILLIMFIYTIFRSVVFGAR